MFVHELRSGRAAPLILVVEDHNLLRQLFIAAFQDSHRIYTASTAAEGWRLYLDRAPDMIFLDIGLPDGNGHELARRIKDNNPDAYVVMTTARNDWREAQVACSNQVDGFIVKPFDKRTIEDCISRYQKTRAMPYGKARV